MSQSPPNCPWEYASILGHFIRIAYLLGCYTVNSAGILLAVGPAMIGFNLNITNINVFKHFYTLKDVNLMFYGKYLD